MTFVRIASMFLLAGLLAACASQPASQPSLPTTTATAQTAPGASVNGLPHKVWTDADVIGKTLDVPRGRDNARYLVTFKADGTFHQRGSDFSNTGRWSVTPSGDIQVFVKKGATLSFYGPAADGRYIYVNPNNTKSGRPWVTFQ